MSRKSLKHITIACGIIAILPLIGLLSAELAVAILNCRVSETGTSDCIVANKDIGMWLAVLYSGGWFSIITVPVAGLMTVICYKKYRDVN
ncbi:hypothetical protein [Pseudoalteromonas piscicida]|uniref:Uncharacterized protein n=1 Tax=Pseudoalteromonas piscicida TaxID=43662 RepID=A0A2A5JR59_PSEO7|nr:hypothetical protein [Pseudoalteromonas piscicida]PCK31857.1 hypothetical protein CEX98_10185 [Pseudoalteromonas piscicida]